MHLFLGQGLSRPVNGNLQNRSSDLAGGFGGFFKQRAEVLRPKTGGGVDGFERPDFADERALNDDFSALVAVEPADFPDVIGVSFRSRSRLGELETLGVAENDLDVVERYLFDVLVGQPVLDFVAGGDSVAVNWPASSS